MWQRQLGFAIGVCLLVTVLHSLGQLRITHAQPAVRDVATSRPLTHEALPEVDPLEVEGNLVVAGSAALLLPTERLYQRFIEAGYAGTIQIMNTGTSDGFQLLCQQGMADVVIASRRLLMQERLACLERDHRMVELRIGTDALVVVVNPDNDVVRKVSFADLAAIFTAEKWSDVNAAWPEEDIIRFVPAANSAAFRFFTLHIFHALPSPLLLAPNTTLSNHDDELTTGMRVNPYAVGFLDYAHYQQQALMLKALSVNGAEPSKQSVQTQDYQLVRPLFLYSSPGIMRAKPQVRAFLNYYVSHANEVIHESGLFVVNPETLAETKRRLKQAGYATVGLKTP